MINLKFHLQPRPGIVCHTVWRTLVFITQMKDDHATNSHWITCTFGRINFLDLGVKVLKPKFHRSSQHGTPSNTGVNLDWTLWVHPTIRAVLNRGKISRELSHLYGHSLYKKLIRGLCKPRTEPFIRPQLVHVSRERGFRAVYTSSPRLKQGADCVIRGLNKARIV